MAKQELFVRADNMSVETLLAIIAIVASFLSLAITSVIAIKSWHKNRVIYGLEELVLRKINGTRDDSSRGLREINAKLKSGNYTIQAIENRQDDDWAIILSRVKKYKKS